MTDKGKAYEIARNSQFRSDFPYNRRSVVHGAHEMAVWKNRQLKYILTAYHKWLDQRGFFEPHLQYDPEHWVETFIADILPQKMKSE